MAQQYKTGLIITGDASGGIRAIKATESELGKLNQGFDRGGRQSKQFGADAARAGRQLSAIDQGASDASRGLAVLRTNVAGVAAAMATAFGAGSIINQAKLIADTDSLAKSIGMATGSLQAWDYAAQQAGLAGGQMGDILKDITERIGEFTAEGTGEAAALFENLNLNIEEMKRLAPDQQLLRIADAISTLETRGEKISYLERLGSDATLLLPLLDDNAAKLREFTNEAEMLGVAMSQVDINNAVEANRAMSQLTGTMDGFTNQIVADLGPGLAMAVGELADFIQESGGAASILNEVKDVATLTAAVMAGRYAASMVASTHQMIERNAASAAAAAADERSMQMAVRRSAAEVTAAKRTLGRAVAEAQATKGTDAHTAALARLGVARQQAIAATAQHTVAVNANAAATQRATVVARAASGAYALIGGPLGVATLAATAFFMFRDSSDEVASSLANMDEPLESVIEDFKTLTTESQRAALIKWGDRQEEEADKARKALSKIREEVLSLGFEDSTGAEARVFFDEINAGFDAVESGAQSLDAMLTGLQEQLEIPDGVMRNLRLLASEYSAGSVSADELGVRLEALTNTFNDVSEGADNAGVSVNSGAPSEKTLEAWGTYNDRLRESIAASRDGGSALGAANRAMDGMGEGVNSVMRGYTAFLTVQDEVLKDQKKAQEESASAAKQAASESARAYEQAARAAKQSAKQQADALRGIQQEMDPLVAEHDKYIERIDVLDQALSDNTLTQEQYGESMRWAAEQYTRAATGAEEYEKQTETLVSTYDRHNQKAQQLRDALEQINQRYRDGEINGDQYARMVGGIRNEMQQLALEAAPISKELARSWEEAANRINETFGDAFTGAYDSFEDFGDKLMDGVKRLIGEITYQATLEPIVIGVTTQARGALGIPGTGGQQGGGLDLSSMSSLKNGWSALKGGVSNIAWTGAGSSYGGTGWANAATQGTGATGIMGGSTANFSGMTGLASAGAGFAGSYAGRAAFGEGRDNDILETAGTLVGAYFGGPLGAAAGSFIGSALASLDKETKFSGRFGTTGTNDPSQYASSGKDGVFEHQDDGENFYGQSALGYTGFLDRGTKRLQRAGIGEDKGWAEELTDGAVARDNLVASLATTTAEIEAMQAAVQGLEASSNTAGELIEFALNERPRAALEALGGHFGEFVRGLEGGIEEVVQQAQVAQQAHTLLSSGMERLNLQFDATAAGAYESASNIAEHAGGVDNLAALQNQYFDGYFTQAERAAFLQEDLTESLAAMGLELPENEAGFRALVEAQNQNTEAGGRNYVQLLQLSGGFSQLQGILGNTSTAADAASESVDNTADSLRQIEAIERERAGINGKLLSALGDSAEMRRLELEAIDPSNRGLQEFVWGIEAFNDQIQAAEQRLSSARNTAASAWQSFDNQAYQQQLTLLEMLNDEEGALALQRERELQSIDPLLHESQRHIWAMQDQARAQEDATQAARGYINEMSRAQEQYSRTVLGINEWLDKENATGGTPGMNFAETQDQLARQLVLAQSGDRDALASITQYADRVLAANEEYNASSAAGQLVKDEVLAALEALPGQISAEEYLAEEIRTALFDALEGKATDSEINALMARVMAGDLSIEAALESIYGASDGTKDNTKTLEERSRDQLQELGWLVDEMSRTTGQFVSLNGTMSSLTSAIAALSSAQNDAAEVKQQRNAYEEAMQKASQYDDAAEGFRNKARATSQNVSDGRITAIRTEIDKYFDDDGEFGANDWNDTLSRLAAEFGRGSAEDVFGQAYASIYRNRTFADRQREKAASISNPQAGGGSAGGGGMDDLARADAYIRRYTDIQDAWNEERAAWQQRSGAKNIQEFGLWHAKNLGIAAGRQFAMGGMFAGGDELGRPAANSIVSRSTFFNIGEMGEEDPEAIMPLSRGAGGRLGIDASGLMRLPDGPLQLPMPEMPPLPQFPQLGGADVLQVLQDVKKELVETRKENKRLLELIGENTGDTVEAIEEAAARSEQQLDEQLDELETISRHSKTEIRTT
ncbi:hypothetical protein [Halomonas sp. KHS3]|uniref:hypothetical protein n=1 Tax=Halomonas sp. KHS3 TaxID=866350 RepID=UPI00059ADE3B|nr:hypothetical protein [Halomonas sp. KHS3]KIN13496.1 hypothetical protein RO22_19720 [Halomonas sp. KHS3]